MSGFEIVGVILGGLPVVYKVAGEYKKGLESFSKWRRYQTEFRRFVNDVDIERQMFTALIDRLLQYTDLSTEQKERLLQGADADGWCRSETEKALRRRLGESFDACKYLLREMENDLIALQAMLSLKDGSVDWAKPGEYKWHYQRKRIAHSFSKKGPETISSLNKNNRRFRDLLDVLDERVGVGKPSQTKAVSVDTTWATVFECIRRQASSLHAALKNGWKCTCNDHHLTSLQLQQRNTSDWTSQFILSFSTRKPIPTVQSRKFSVTVKSPKTTETSLATRPCPAALQEGYLNKLKSNIDQRTPASDHLAFYNESDFRTKSTPNPTSSFSYLRKAFKSSHAACETNPNNCQSTLVQTKPKKTVRWNGPPVLHSQSTPNLTAPATTNPEVSIEISDLCSTLERFDLRASCLGYLSCPDNHHHEFRPLNDGPKSPLPSTAKITSLEFLLSNPLSLRFTRKQRFRLTVVLASSLLQLQTTPWITGKLSKKDIFFESSTSEVFSEYPYIHQSFPSCTNNSNSSQPSLPPTLTTSQTRLLTRASLTSLGILLLELCFAAPIELQHALRAPYLTNGQPHNDTDYLTARDWIPDIEEEGGEAYMNAVKACFEFDGKPDWGDGAFVAGVYARVVQGLEVMLGELGWGGEE